MNTEYTSLRNEINQYKTGQITLFTATASATGIMLGIFINLVKGGEFNPLYAILTMVPLIVIIPSAFMFFEKAVKINRLEAYCAVYTEQFLRKPKNSENYLGYSNYKSAYIDRYSKPIKEYQKTTGKYLTYSQANAKVDLSSIIKRYNKWFIHKEKKYWVNFCYAYCGLVCTCFIVYITYAFGSFSYIYEGFCIALTKYNPYCISIFIFLALSVLIIDGRTDVRGYQYWSLIIFFQILAFVFLMLILFLWIIYSNLLIVFMIEISLPIIAIICIYMRKKIHEKVRDLKITNYITEGAAFFIYMCMTGSFGLYLLISLLTNNLSDKAFISITYLTIMATTIIWIFISTFALILGATSYKSVKDKWVNCIKQIQFDELTKDYPRIK